MQTPLHTLLPGTHVFFVLKCNQGPKKQLTEMCWCKLRLDEGSLVTGPVSMEM